MLLFLGLGCKSEPVTTVFLQNTTCETIVVANPFMKQTEDGYDFVISAKESRYYIYLCPPNTIHHIHGWYDKDVNYATANDTLVFYIIPTMISTTYTWDSIVENRLIKYKYMLSFDDVEKLNYKIPYPPNEETMGMNIINFQEDEK